MSSLCRSLALVAGPLFLLLGASTIACGSDDSSPAEAPDAAPAETTGCQPAVGSSATVTLALATQGASCPLVTPSFSFVYNDSSSTAIASLVEDIGESVTGDPSLGASSSAVVKDDSVCGVTATESYSMGADGGSGTATLGLTFTEGAAASGTETIVAGTSPGTTCTYNVTLTPTAVQAR